MGYTPYDPQPQPRDEIRKGYKAPFIRGYTPYDPHGAEAPTERLNYSKTFFIRG
jgi:hypothetical protein